VDFAVSVGVSVASLTTGLIEKDVDAEQLGTASRREVVVKRVQIAKPVNRPQLPVEIDTRTPSGRVLPF